jgi:hypothetical protein
MRRLLFVLLLLVAAGVGLGFYRGWFSLSTTGGSGAGQTGVHLTIDQDKMKADSQKAKEKVSDAVDQSKEKLKGQ